MSHTEQTLQKISETALDMRTHWVNYCTAKTEKKKKAEWAHFMCAFAVLMRELGVVVGQIAMESL